MATKNKPGLPPVRAIERAATILRAFTLTTPQLTLSETARRAALDKGTTRRLLHTLRRLEWVGFDERTQTYSLGIGLLTFIPALGFGHDIDDITAPVLARLSEEVGATSFLWMYFRGEAICIDRVRAVNVSIDIPWSRIGTLVPLHLAGGPRVVLAHIADEERNAVLNRPLAARTPTTQTEPQSIEASCAVIRKRGWELAVDDYIVGLSGLGVPVFSQEGHFVASLSISTTTPQLPMIDNEPRHLGTLRQAAMEIGARLRA